ncbi:protein Mo25 [Trichuris trichiura]|uniref:Protein Mo25 n=1 Tax=Trichuris trichiura TaxID=36087 RepID=A0A077Z8C8_TRITR|nr:protein Mo25 [Trichuris trichiura]
MPLFGKSLKHPADIVKSLKDAVVLLERGEKKCEKARESGTLSCFCLYATLCCSSTCPVCCHFFSMRFICSRSTNKCLYFQSKKDVALIFNNLLRRQIGMRSPTVEYLYTKPEVLIALIKGYEVAEIAHSCGSMLRECVRHEPLARMILSFEEIYNFFSYVEGPTFEVASDAFSTFKELITKHKVLCAEFLEQNYDRFFDSYQQLLNSENYVTRRQSLKLLGELLLDRHNFNVMTRYISNPENLKLMMNLLIERSRSIQFEAFHVFKVFVANPAKPKPIADILIRNRERLVDFLSKFHAERTEDEQFNDEKAYLIKQIQEMK